MKEWKEKTYNKKNFISQRNVCEQNEWQADWNILLGTNRIASPSSSSSLPLPLFNKTSSSMAGSIFVVPIWYCLRCLIDVHIYQTDFHTFLYYLHILVVLDVDVSHHFECVGCLSFIRSLAYSFGLLARSYCVHSTYQRLNGPLISFNLYLTYFVIFVCVFFFFFLVSQRLIVRIFACISFVVVVVQRLFFFLFPYYLDTKGAPFEFGAFSLMPQILSFEKHHNTNIHLINCVLETIVKHIISSLSFNGT